MRHRTHFRIRMRKLLSGFLAVSTAITMLGGSAATLLAEEPSTEYALAGAGTGEDITIHFGDEEDKSISVHVNPESNAETLAGLGTEAAGDETESETENTGLKEVKAGGFVTISSVDETLLPEEAEASAEILSGKAENTAVEKVEEVAATEPTSEASDPTGSIAQDSKEEKTAGPKNAPEEEATPEAGGKTEYQAFDISLDNVDEDQYREGFKVEVSLPEDVRGRDFRLFHIHEGEEPVEIPVETVSTIDPETGLEVVLGFEFTTDGFSEFVLQYTVDFHYEINGKLYEFGIPGGGFVSFTDLVEVLGITGDADSDNKAGNTAEGDATEAQTTDGMLDVTPSDAAKKFVEDVESVVFSSPELVWVGKAESRTTVGALKEANALECEYSAELTKEQIDVINGTEVESGDWALISLRPFLSEESLTVTMKDGEVFTIRVTDGQIRKTVIDARGGTWEITVTYGEDAQIPDEAELKVSEILPEDEEYADYYQKSLEKVGVRTTEIEDTEDFQNTSAVDVTEDADERITDLIGNNDDEEDAEEPAKKAASEYARIFDIEIWANDQKVEPAADVTVSIRLLDAPEETNATPQVVHFAEDGTELMELKEKAENSEDEGIQFVTDEFSVYSVVYTVDFSFNINGKEISFSLEGGDSTSFREIIEKFEILRTEDIDDFINNIAKVEFTNPAYLWNGKLTEDAFAGDLKEKNNLDIQYASNLHEGNILAMNEHYYSAPDWVLIALKPFTSEETLTVTMKNGEVFTIDVTDAQSDAIHNSDGTVQTIPNPQGTTFDLFNYYVSSETKTTPERDQWPGHIHDDSDFWKFNWYDLAGNFACEWGEGFYRGYDNNNNYLLGYGNNLGINKNHVLKFSPANAGTVIDGTKGTATKDVNGGSGLNGWTQDADPYQGIVQKTLVNGYPKMTTDSNLGTDGDSLAYLFDSTNQEGKDRYGAVNHLLYVDPNGYYTYDSRDFKAQIQSDNNFIVSDQPDTDDTELKGFWPFGDQIYWSGLHMNTQFSMPVNGRVLSPRGEYRDMQFEFSGDDDTWLYIDGVLVGDGGGIHNRTEIDINFASGTATVTGKKDKVHTGTFEETKYLDDIFKAAGRYNDSEWEDIGDGSGHKRFKAGTYHTFDMFYLERGGGESNLYIHYNLVSTADFTGHKAYEGFAEDERMVRDQFQFELIGLDGQYQSVWNPETQTATVSLVDAKAHAIMPIQGTEEGDGTVANPRKVYSGQAWNNADSGEIGGYIFETGVTEEGNINFGLAEINAKEMLNCDQGIPSVYRYIIREIVPDDAVNAEGVIWADATDEQKAQGGFVKDQVQYDGTIYYMTARVISWQQTGADGNSYTAYGLSKTYYTDDTFTQVNPDVTFVDFQNLYAPDRGEAEFIKTDGYNAPLAGAEFTLYNDSACTKIARDLDGTEQVITTGTDGKVLFDNMAAPRTYYMKETAIPSGYEANHTVYKVIIEDSKDKTKHSSITALDDESESEIAKIINVKPGEFSVIKEWQDQYGQAVDVNDRQVRVKVQRQHYAGGSGTAPNTVRFTIRIQGRSDLEFTYEKRVAGGVVTVDWWDTNQPIVAFNVTDSSGHLMTIYDRPDYWDDVNHKNRKAVIYNVQSDIQINVTYLSDKYWLFDGDHAKWMKNVSVVGNGMPAIPPELTEDTEFNHSTEDNRFAVLSSPSWSRKWTIGGTSSDYSGYDFPASDGTNPYKYYVVEVDANGNPLNVGEETKDGFKLKRYVTSSGVTTVVNEITVPESIDITIRKTDNMENSTNYLDGAVFKLMYRSDSSGTFTGVSRESVKELDSDSQFTVPASGIKLTGLVDGEYQLREISSPEGYVITDSCPVSFTVLCGKITGTEGTITGVRYTAATSTSDAEFIIPNPPGAVLPASGGPGTRLFTILGSILLLGAGLLLWRRRRII